MLTQEQKDKIINRNYDWLQSYIKDVMDALPDLENSVTIEGIALSWAKLDERRKKGCAKIEDAIELYKKEYAYDSENVSKLTGKKSHELNIPPVKKVEYTVNEDLSAATIEQMAKDVAFLKQMSTDEGICEFFDLNGDRNRFYGTVIDKEKVPIIKKVNGLMDILATVHGVTVDKFDEDIDPRVNVAVFGINANSMFSFSDTAYKAFKEAVNLCDSILVIPRTERSVRIVLSISNIWKKSIQLTDEEMKDYGYWEEDEEEFI